MLYLKRIHDAITAALATDNLNESRFGHAQDLLAELSERGLVIVEVPEGIKHDFAGIAE